MQKYILVEMPDKSTWKVKAETIVVNRAKYYATQDEKKGEDYWKTFEKEYRETLEDSNELLDWAANNMNWVDVSHGAVKVPKEEKGLTHAEFQEGWCNGKKTIVEEE